MFAHHRRRIRLLFAVAEGLITFGSFAAAYYTRTRLHFSKLFFLTRETYIVLALFSIAVWAVLGARKRVFEAVEGGRSLSILAETIRQCLLGTVLLVLFQYLINLGHELSRTFLAFFGAYTLVALALFRRKAPALVGAFQREFGRPYCVVLVGATEKVTRLQEELVRRSPFRIQISAILSPEECVNRIPELLARHVVDEVIFGVETPMLSTLEPVFLQCDEEGVRTRVALDFFPHVNSEITLDRVGDWPLLTFSAAPLEDLSLLAKRSIDLVLAAVAIVVLLPVFALIALLIRATSPGAVIFSQRRCGLNGRQFTLYKFRSMVQEAEALKPQLEPFSEREIAFKLRKDPRVTPLGRWLRKYSLDELPQLWNVVRGDMSLVGPRPPLPDEVARYERWQKRRLRMRPGLTCLWAVMGRDRMDFNTWMRTDLSYIDNWSLQLDWAILLRTIPYVLAGKGAN